MHQFFILNSDESFLDPETTSTYCPSGRVPKSHQTRCYSCQSGQQTSQINDSTVRSKRIAQENSYHGPSQSFLRQSRQERCFDCEQRVTTPTCEHQLTSQTYHQPHWPKNGQSVVSLTSVISENFPPSSENLQIPSRRNNTMTWPFKKGDGMRGELHQCQFQPVEQQACTHQDINYQQDGERLDSRPFHSLISTTSADGPRYDSAVRGPCSEGTVDCMMMENPTRASPNQLESKFIPSVLFYKIPKRNAKALDTFGKLSNTSILI